MAAGDGAATGAASGFAAGGPVGAVVGGALGALGGAQQARASKRFRRRQRAAIASAREFADETVRGITESDLFTSARDFIQTSFDQGADSPLARDAGLAIRSAQAARGTFAGNLGATQEAIGTSAAAQRLRQSLLPSALSFATAPETLRQSVLGFEAPLRVGAATGATIGGLGAQGSLGSSLGSMLQGAVGGAAGGFQIGSAFDQQNEFNNRLDALRASQSRTQGLTASGFLPANQQARPDSLQALIASFQGGV